jgi:hypothetical protein
MNVNHGYSPNLPPDTRVNVILRNGRERNWPVGGGTRWSIKPKNDASRVADIVEWELA